jgi:hypothetical protein
MKYMTVNIKMDLRKGREFAICIKGALVVIKLGTLK